MSRFISQVTAIALFSLATLVPAMAQQAAPAPAPAPGSPAAFVSQQQLADQLKAAIAKPSDPATSPIGISDQYSINEVHRVKDGAPAIHPGHTELHFILEGSGTFVTGGKIVAVAGQSQSIVEGGVSQAVKKGDAVLVPPNTPHWYQHVDSPITYLEVRFVAPGADAARK
jgi:mannose-6-phosphate isomerase-like protein (cupin superfamily)